MSWGAIHALKPVGVAGEPEIDTCLVDQGFEVLAHVLYGESFRTSRRNMGDHDPELRVAGGIPGQIRFQPLGLLLPVIMKVNETVVILMRVFLSVYVSAAWVLWRRS